MNHKLTAGELAQIRDDIEALMPDTCDILGVTMTSDGAGSWTEVWGTASASVPCRLDFKGYGREAVIAGATQPYKTGVVSMAYDQTITTENRLLISSVTYNVTGVNDSQSWIGVKRVTVERIP